MKNKRLVLDLGSHSAKLYLSGTSPQLIAQNSWALLETGIDESRIESVLSDLLKKARISLGSNSIDTVAVGTEAARRNEELARVFATMAKRLNFSYRTISQRDEAMLIRNAALRARITPHKDVFNVGGGSIQIWHNNWSETALLNFGISDLNKNFQLGESPQNRRVEECIGWVESKLPDIRNFIYTGGERNYLEKAKVSLREDGYCTGANFAALATKMALCETQNLASLCDLDLKWLGGAVASNCIVLAALRKSKAAGFWATDFNIAQGLVSSV